VAAANAVMKRFVKRSAVAIFAASIRSSGTKWSYFGNL
jgi:hypothetical protein